MDPALRELLARTPGGAEIEAIARLRSSAADIPGIRVISRFGRIATCRIRADHVADVYAHGDLLSLKAPRLVGPEPLDRFARSRGAQPPALAASDIRRPPGLALTGAGVVVGVLDWGVDVGSAAFRVPTDGSTRLLALWDQRAGERDAPEPYGYGTLHSRSDINAALGTGRPYEALGYHPAEADRDGTGTHGTHVLDIAAGNGGAGGPVSCAPEADIVFVHLGDRIELGNLSSSVRLLEACAFVARTARAAGKPWVVNISAGRHGGPHDGRSLTELAFDDLLASRRGCAIVLSAGNYRTSGTHATKRVRPGRAEAVTFVTHPADLTPNEVEAWYSGDDAMAVRLVSPTGRSTPLVDIGTAIDVRHPQLSVGRLFHRRDPNNLDIHVDLFLDPTAPAGAWTLWFEPRRVRDGRVHVWLERDEGCGPCQARFIESDAVASTTTGTLANGRLPLVVGAYDGTSDHGTAASFSSTGPTRDARGKPDLLAPGVGVLAARSAPQGATENQGGAVRKSGTSMAAPHVTSAVAMCLQAEGPNVRIGRIRALVLGTTRRGHGAAEFGLGRLDVDALASRLTRPDRNRTIQAHRAPDRELGTLKESQMNTTLMMDAGPRTNACVREPHAMTLLLPWERAFVALVNGVDEQVFRSVVVLVGPVIHPMMVRVASSIVPVALQQGNAITIGDNIWFPRTVDTTTVDDLVWLAHESAHVVDYARSSTTSFLRTYVWQAAWALFRHDHIPLEQRADRVEQIARGLLTQHSELVTVIASCDNDAALDILRRNAATYRKTVHRLAADPSSKESMESVSLMEDRPIDVRTVRPSEERKGAPTWFEDGLKAGGTTRFRPTKHPKDRVLAAAGAAEGGFDTVNLYDRGILSWGFMQWSAHRGSLQELMHSMASELRQGRPDAWESCFDGLVVERVQGRAVFVHNGRPAVTNAELRQLFRGSTEVGQYDPTIAMAWVTRFATAGRMDEVQTLQRAHAHNEIDRVFAYDLARLFADPQYGRVGEYVSDSVKASALMFGMWTNNRKQSYVELRRAIDASQPSGATKHPSTWDPGWEEPFADQFERTLRRSRFSVWGDERAREKGRSSRTARILEGLAAAERDEGGVVESIDAEGDPSPFPGPLTKEEVISPDGRHVRISEYGTDPAERRSPGQKPSLTELFWVDFEVDAKGAMTVSARTVDPQGVHRSPTLNLRAEFAKALTHFQTKANTQVREFVGDWSWMTATEMSTNLSEYRRLRAGGAKPEEAARETPSGKVAVGLGFTEVKVLSDGPEPLTHIGDNKHYQRVRVSFSRPGGGRPPTGVAPLPAPDPSTTGGSTTKTSTRVAAGGALLVLGTSVALNWLIEGDNEKRIREQMAKLEPTLRKEQQDDPTLGFLLVFRYKGGATGSEGARASARFAALSYRRGYTRSEAEAKWKAEARSDPDSTYEFGWIESAQKPSPMVVYAPFPKVALAKFADIRSIEFQRVQFREWGGFDTAGKDGPVSAATWAEVAESFRFLVLRVPSQINVINVGGRLTTRSVPSLSVTVVGGTVPALDLDGDPGVTVWPADAETKNLFDHTKRISDKEGKLSPIANIGLVRCLKPAQVRIISMI